MNARPTHCPGPRLGELAPAWSLDLRSENRCTAPLGALPNAISHPRARVHEGSLSRRIH